MSQPEQPKITVYAGGDMPEQVPAPVQGTFEVPVTRKWPGSSVLGGNTWPAQKIQRSALLGGHVLYSVMTITGSDDAIRQHYLLEGEGIFTPDEDHSNTATAEG